ADATQVPEATAARAAAAARAGRHAMPAGPAARRCAAPTGDAATARRRSAPVARWCTSAAGGRSPPRRLRDPVRPVAAAVDLNVDTPIQLELDVRIAGLLGGRIMLWPRVGLRPARSV